MNPDERMPLVKISHLKQYFVLGKGQILKAVDDVSFDIYKGETLGLVGESGCGKTTLGRTIVRLYEATGGSVIFDGKEITHAMSASESHNLTKRMQMIFQDPYASLNPRMKVTDIVAEGLDAHHLYTSKEERSKKVFSALRSVGLSPEHGDRYPHEFSGGQRQRIGIARALTLEPDFIICDEPISALDVSIQAQIVNLLENLQKKRALTYLFIAHDLSMVRHISDRIIVMYLGSIMELCKSEELFHNPVHPYTQALLSAVPIPDPRQERARDRIILEGVPSSPINTADKCPFSDRCRYCTARCLESRPHMHSVGDQHYVACHNIEKSAF